MEIRLAEIASFVGGKISGDPDKIISGAAPFAEASHDQVTMAAGAKFLSRIHETHAGAIIISQAATKRIATETAGNLLIVQNPQAAFARILNLFYSRSAPQASISPQSSIGERFQCGGNVFIAPFVCIGDGVIVGDRVRLESNVVIGSNVKIGSDVTIYPNVTIYDGCRIGSRVTIHAGTVIGSDGFGFAPDGENYIKIPHTGIVQIDDDVEIGAGNTIDRATFGTTWIKSGVKTDNLVHIAHNVTVGENSVIVAQVGIAGSTRIGKHAIVAGQAGIGGHLTIGDNVTIGPQAGVAKSVASGSIVSGTPEMPHRLWLKVARIIPSLPEMIKKISLLEKRLDDMGNKRNG